MGKTRKILIIIPHDAPGEAYTREMRCQEKKAVLGTLKPPLTPALLCAVLEKNHVPFAALENLPADEAAASLQKDAFRPDLILFPTCTPTVSRDMAFAAALKHRTGALTAAFGPHTSGVPEKTLEQFPRLDIAIIGEPEETALELADESKPLKSIPGIAFRDENGRPALTQKRPGVPDLDALPMPAWRRFNLQNYRVPLFGKRFLPVELSRGCPHRCGFCVVPLTHGGKVREKSPRKIVEEIALMKERHGVSFFYFWGDTAVLNRSATEELCELIIRERLDIQWISNTRPETVQDAAFAKKLRQSGCRMLSMGAESADAALLEKMGKKINPDALKRSVAALKQAGIKTFVFFIFGYPGETEQTMEKTFQFALDLDPDYANFYPAVPYPGTPLWEQCARQGLLLTDDWSKVDFSDYVLRIPGVPADGVMRMARAARRRFYTRPRYILKTARDVMTPSRAIELIRAAPSYLNL